MHKGYQESSCVLDKIEEKEDEILLHCHLQNKSMKFENEISKTCNSQTVTQGVHETCGKFMKSLRFQ